MKVETINNNPSTAPPPDDDYASMTMTGRPVVVVDEKEVKVTTLQVKRMRLEDSDGNGPTVVSTIDNATVAGTTTIVELNVGGEVFVTTRETLLQSKSAFFERLLAVPVDENGGVGGDGWVQVPGESGTLLRDAHNRLFIDRSPDLFRSVLDFLRTGFIATLQDPNEKKALAEEAEYYQLNNLVERLKYHGNPYDPFCLSASDAAIREEAVAIRRAFREEAPDAAAKATKKLIDLFDPVSGDLTIQTDWNSPCTSIDATVLFQKHAISARKKNKALPSTLDEFKSRFVEYAGPMLKDFPLGEKVVCAGGSVVSALLGLTHSKEGDVDLFLVAPTEEEAKAKYDQIIEYFAAKGVEETKHKQLLVVRSAYAVTLFVGGDTAPVQIILTHHKCAAEAIFNFDIDCCQVVYDGSSVRATPSALRAMTTGVNFADPERRSPTFEHRLAKYADRGFTVAVPGLDLSRVTTKYLRNGFFSHGAGGGLRHVKLEFSKPGVLSTVSVDSEEETGLAKLLVYANRFNSKGGHWDPTGTVQLRSQQAYVAFGYGRSSGNDNDFGNSTYLIDVEKLMKSGAAERWTNPTPPFHPPEELIQPIVEKEDSAGRAGPLLVNKGDPKEVEWHLIQRLNNIAKDGTFEDLPYEEKRRFYGKEHMMMPPLCAWNLLDLQYFTHEIATRGGTYSGFCHYVDEASYQYPNHAFSADSHGMLPQHLTFLSANKMEVGRMDSGGWTDGVYAPTVCISD